MARISLRPQTQIVLQVKARTLELRIVPGHSKGRQPKTPSGGASGCRLPEGWSPSREDESFARRHGMNPKGVVHALRKERPADCDAKGGETDGSALFRDWLLRHAIEAPEISRYFNGNVVSPGPAAPISSGA